MEKTEVSAFVLKAARWSHSRWQLSLFTKEQGRLTVWYHNAKQAPLPFTAYWMVLRENPKGYGLEKLERLSMPYAFSGKVLFAAWYLNELILKLLQIKDSAESIYLLYEQALKALIHCKTQQDMEVALRTFEWFFLRELGYGLRLTQDVHDQPIEAHQCYQYLPNQGFLPSDIGHLGQHLLALAEGFEAPAASLRLAKQLMRQAIDAALGGQNLETRALFRQAYPHVHE